MLLGTFLTDVDKAYDFLELSKVEFLESYSYLTEQEYDETNAEFLSDKTGNLAELMRDAENMLIEENTYFDNENTNPYKYANVTGEQLKSRVYEYAQSHLSKEEMQEFQEICEDMGC
jgi:hypothetical protein